MPLLARVGLDLLEEPEDRAGDEACVILIGEQVLEEGILVLLLAVLRDGVLPVTPEHRVGLPRTRLPIRENC